MVKPVILHFFVYFFVFLFIPLGSVSGSKSACIGSDGKRQPLFFDSDGRMVYPARSCVFYRQGEYFNNIKWVGCAGKTGNSNYLMTSKEEKSIAGGGTLLDVDTLPKKTLRRLICRRVNTSTIQKRNGSKNIFDVSFVFDRYTHVIYTIKWDHEESRPIWVRHVPSINVNTFSVDNLDNVYDDSVVDTGIRSSWRASKLIFGKHNALLVKKAYKNLYCAHGLSRGHLAPAGDFLLASERWTTFQLANVVPQPQHHNNGPWKKIESHIRTSPEINNNDVYFVETGPIYTASNDRYEGVSIPSGFYKKILDRDENVIYRVVSLY